MQHSRSNFATSKLCIVYLRVAVDWPALSSRSRGAARARVRGTNSSMSSARSPDSNGTNSNTGGVAEASAATGGSDGAAAVSAGGAGGGAGVTGASSAPLRALPDVDREARKGAWRRGVDAASQQYMYYVRIVDVWEDRAIVADSTCAAKLLFDKEVNA